MYLQSFRVCGVGPGNWGGMALWNDAPSADIVLDEIDATLNSWSEAHAVFNTYQAGASTVKLAAFQAMKPLVHKVIHGRLMNTVNSYPVEAFTFALLERWIANWDH